MANWALWSSASFKNTLDYKDQVVKISAKGLPSLSYCNMLVNLIMVIPVPGCYSQRCQQ